MNRSRHAGPCLKTVATLARAWLARVNLSQNAAFSIRRARPPVAALCCRSRPPVAALYFCAAAACVLLLAAAGAAQDDESAPKPPKDIEAASLPLRTALHRDPTLAAPLDRLLAMYRSAGKVDRLLAMYRTHLAQYPADVKARTVLVRLLAATGDPEALHAARDAVAQFPQDAYLHYLLFEVLQGRHNPKALDQLDQAIELQAHPNVKIAWLDALLPIAVLGDRRPLAEKHLRVLVGMVDTPSAQLEVARKMIRFKFYGLALELLGKEMPEPPSPEVMVSLELEAVTAEVGLKRMKEAAARLDRLLGKLTADYWRRPEIVRRRLAMVESQQEREAMIRDARQRVDRRPRDEAAVLDLAQILAGLQFRRKALQVLLEGGKRIPKSEQIEKQTLEMLDRLRDDVGREEYLTRRIEAQPHRDDLMLELVKTLYVLERPEEALAKFTGATETLPVADRLVQTLQMARFLRGMGLMPGAAELFRRAVEWAPQRLDIRRELAETCLAMDRREESRKVLAKTISKKADLENLLDMVQFMIEQGMFLEAKAALTGRIEQEKENLELRLVLLGVQQRLGEVHKGRELIEACRKLADTGARYRRWLEAAVAFHDTFDSVEEFLKTEQVRLDEEPLEWTERRLERRLAFIATSTANGQPAEAAVMLQGDLGDNPPKPFRLRLRRELVAILDRDRTRTAELKEHLKQWAEEDPKLADECRLRLALLHVKEERPDLAVQELEHIDIAKIDDPALLVSLLPLIRQYAGSHIGYGPDGQPIELPNRFQSLLRRLVDLDPTNRGHWERWLGALATTGDEAGLRTAIRRLLAGVDKMELADETRNLLEGHLADSYWRSIATELVDGDKASLAEALALVDSAERIAGNDQQWLWGAWVRAYLLNRLGREKARDEAIAELRKMAARVHLPSDASKGDKPKSTMRTWSDLAGQFQIQAEFVSLTAAVVTLKEGDGTELQIPLQTLSHHDQQTVMSLVSAGVGAARKPKTAKTPKTPEAPEPVRIVFPDGLSVSLDHACKLLTAAPGPAHGLRPGRQQGPLGRFRVKWVFDAGSLVTAIIPLAEDRVLIADAGRTLHYVDAASGKLLRKYSVETGGSATRWAPVFDGGKRFYAPGFGQVDCYAAEDGRLLWSADVGATGAAPKARGQVPVAIFLVDGKVLTCDPVSATLTRIDPATGKIVWDHTLPDAKPFQLNPYNSGASLSGGRLLIYGSKTAVVDAESGEIEWSFEPLRVRCFPVKLSGSSAFPASRPPSNPPYYGGFSRHGRWSYGHGPGGAARQVPCVDYLQPRGNGRIASNNPMRLTSSAVAWASMAGQGGMRRGILIGERLLLLDQSGLRIIRTDLPLAGKQISVGGQFVGMAGRTACFLSGSTLQLVDVTTGALQSHHVGDSLRKMPVYALVDGLVVYIVGQEGMIGVHARTAQRIFQFPWPAEVGLSGPTANASGSAAARSAIQRGYVVYSHYGQPHYGGGYRGGYPGQYPNVQAPLEPAGCADRGVLYVTATPTRVIALTTQKAAKPKPVSTEQKPVTTEPKADGP